jgi:hypothetical protein
MSVANPMVARGQQKRPLAACLALALAAAGACTASDAEATTFTVTNCSDSGAGSLRAIIGAGTTLSGDTVNFSASLGCSTITLSSGEIVVSQTDLFINGPGSAALTVDGGFVGRVMRHSGTGTLTINGLTLTHGNYTSSAIASGGCLVSNGSVTLIHSTVSSCLAIAQGNARAYGGGIFTGGDLYLASSRVAYNNAVAAGNQNVFTDASGGGVFVSGTLQTAYSTIAYNGAGTPDQHGYGGGLFTYGTATIHHTTISGNRANVAGGWHAGSNSPAAITIADSTISGNSATKENGGMRATVPLTISNSTIAFNESEFYFGGLYAAAAVTLQSSIIANNIARDTLAPSQRSDLAGAPATPAVSGSNNLITSTTLTVPVDTITACPKLGPLADNGARVDANGAGYDLTHALQHDSPAINHGNSVVYPMFDQRGFGFPRLFGAGVDIGAYEWQGTPDDRIFVSRLENACDS